MIFDKIANAKKYLGITPELDRALMWLQDAKLDTLEEGTHYIDQEKVYVNVMTAQTNPDVNREYEFHRAHYDIQIDISGKEDVRFGESYKEITKPWKEDIGFGICDCTAMVHLAPGRFVICEPEEPHLPGIAPEGQEEKIRKAVIKVQVSQT